nr:DUF4153 domain-containing protein [Paenibacillus methanolicus]
MALYAIFYYAMKGRIGGLDQWRGQCRSGWLLFIPIAMLSASYALFSNELFRALNALLIPAMLLAQATQLTRASSKPWYRAAFYADLFHISFIRAMEQGAVPFRLIRELTARGGRREEGRAAAGQALLGLLLAVPVLIVSCCCSRRRMASSKRGLAEFPPCSKARSWAKRSSGSSSRSSSRCTSSATSGGCYSRSRGRVWRSVETAFRAKPTRSTCVCTR